MVRVKNILLMLLLGSLLALYSCKGSADDLPEVEDCDKYFYEDCNTIQPIEADMTIHFSINTHIKQVAFEVYKGYVDDNHLFFRDTTTNTSVTYRMPVDEYWSVLAIYQRDGKTIKVIDGDKIRVHSKKVCDSTCWSVSNIDLEVELK
jgi:hypothetical protein